LSREYKHILEISSRFKKTLNSLSEELKHRIVEKVEELLMRYGGGKSLKGQYRGFKVLRIGKYRLIYSNEEWCKIYLYDVRHREVAYI